MSTSTGAEQERLAGFLKDMLKALGRTERQRWGGVYVRGLLETGGRKTAAGMATHAPDGNVQALQQFIGQSPWPWEPIRKQLAHRLVGALQPVAAWLIDDTGFPKKGTHSVGVARQYSGTLGKIGNCQVAVSLHYATDEAAVPLDFTLYLPEEWLVEEPRRQEAEIPKEVTFQPKWALALGLLDRAAVWEVPPGVVVADAGYGNTSEFRAGLVERGLAFVVGVQGTTGVWADWGTTPQSRGRPGRPRLRPAEVGAPMGVSEMSRNWPQERWQRVTWREGAKGPLVSRFATARVRTSHRAGHGGTEEGFLWLLVEWPETEEAPTKFWLSNLPAETDLLNLVRLAKIRWWIEQGYQQLKNELGLDHYEGRTWQGWHHHVTMTMLAFGFLALESMYREKNFWTALVPAEGTP